MYLIFKSTIRVILPSWRFFRSPAVFSQAVVDDMVVMVVGETDQATVIFSGAMHVVNNDTISHFVQSNLILSMDWTISIDVPIDLWIY